MPVQVRRALGLDHKGAVASVSYDQKSKRLYIEKPLTLQDVNQMNQAILKQNKVSLVDYKNGDGFRAYVDEKYGPWS